MSARRGVICVNRSWDPQVGPSAPESRAGRRRVPMSMLVRRELRELKPRSGRHGDGQSQRYLHVPPDRDAEDDARLDAYLGADVGPKGVTQGGQAHTKPLQNPAERGGFEPPNEVNPRYAISSRARSTTPAPLRKEQA